MRSASALAVGDDLFRLALRQLAPLGLVLGQHLGRLVLEAAGVVELGLDALGRDGRAPSAPCGGRRARRTRPIRMTKAIATQVSGSYEHQNYPFKVASTALLTAHCCRAADAGEPLHDGTGRIRGDAADIAHCGRAGGGDGFLGVGELACELCPRASCVRPRTAAFSFSRVSAPIAWALGAGSGEIALIGLQRGFRIASFSF